jgi:hypothetical protein
MEGRLRKGWVEKGIAITGRGGAPIDILDAQLDELCSSESTPQDRESGPTRIRTHSWTESLPHRTPVASSTPRSIQAQGRGAMDMNNLGFENGYFEDNKSDHSEACVHDLVVLGNWKVFF